MLLQPEYQRFLLLPAWAFRQGGQEIFRINTIKSPAVQGTCRACAPKGKGTEGRICTSFEFSFAQKFREMERPGRANNPTGLRRLEGRRQEQQ